MKERIENVKSILSEKLTFYPIFIGALFLVNELRQNSVYYSFKENTSLILTVLLFALLVNFLSYKLFKNKIKGVIIASIFVFINLFYLDLFRIISNLKVLSYLIKKITPSHPGVIIFSLLLLVWLLLALIIIKTNRFSKVFILYLNVTMIAFIFVELVKWICVPPPQIILADNDPFVVNSDLRKEQKPDIYYLILDAYTSSRSLKQHWNYDNSIFEDSLKQIGFTIPEKSKTDYTSTPYCIASYLNSSSLVLDSTLQYNEHNLLKLIINNRLYDWLKANGYSCNNYSPFDTFGSKKFIQGYMINHILQRTIWFAISTKLIKILSPSSIVSQTNLKIFSELNLVCEKDLDTPKFTYAHVMMPHSPYYFNEIGEPFNKNESISDKQKYLRQLIFTNYLTLKLINHLITFSPKKPIIIIQGDHGYRYLDDTTPLEKSIEAHSIFFAIYNTNGMNIQDTFNPAITFKNLIEKINN